MSVPQEIIAHLRSLLWKRADDLHWMNLPLVEKARLYDIWSREPEIGGLLSSYMDVAAVRVYIKDTLLKAYTGERSADWEVPQNALGLPPGIAHLRGFEKPHGRLLSDGRVISWGAARNWKHVLLATHERAFGHPDRQPYGVVLTESSGRYGSSSDRQVVEDVAAKLGIAKLIWLE